MHVWQAPKGVVAGKDVTAGGTWLGAKREGGGAKLALVTNYRDGAQIAKNKADNRQFRSRGELVLNYLAAKQLPTEFANSLSVADYDGFNMLLWQAGEPLQYVSNQSPSLALGPGLYGLSNHTLETPWPKLRRLKENFRTQYAGCERLDVDALFALLRDDTQAPLALLPNTGIGQPFEQLLSSIFITSPAYGTRCSTLALYDQQGEMTLIERTYDVAGNAVTPDIVETL